MIDQATAQVAAQAAQQSNEMISSQLGGAVLLAYVLQWAKSSKLVPWISEHTKGINYVITGLLALVAAVGIHYQFDATSGTLTIGGLTAGSITHGLWEWCKQWAFQQASANVITTKTIAEAVKEGNVEIPTGIQSIKIV